MKKLERSTPQMEKFVHRTTITQTLCFGLWQSGKPYKIPFEVFQKPCWKLRKVLWLWYIFAMFERNPTLLIILKTNPTAKHGGVSIMLRVKLEIKHFFPTTTYYMLLHGAS